METLCYNIKVVGKKNARYFVNPRTIEVWLSLVERCVRDAEAAGSSPVTSTIFAREIRENRVSPFLLQTCISVLLGLSLCLTGEGDKLHIETHTQSDNRLRFFCENIVDR